MKKAVLVIAALAGIGIITPAFAQDDKVKDKSKEKVKSSDHIIIRKKGDKDTKITVETRGDEIFINGKPLSEYKDDDVTVSKGRGMMRLRDGDTHVFAPGADGYRDLFSDSSFGGKKAFLGLTTSKADKGVKVTNVSEDGAAAKAGIKEGDVITKLGEKVINSPEELSNAIAAFKPKDQVKLSYSRDGKQNETTATLGERSFYRSFSFSGPGSFDKMEGFDALQGLKDLKIFDGHDMPNAFKYDGSKGHTWTMSSKGKLGIKIQDTEEGNGVKIMDVEKESAAEKAGLKKDDVLTEIAGKKVSNTDEAREELSENKDKTEYKVKAKRGESEMTFDIKIPKKLKTTNL